MRHDALLGVQTASMMNHRHCHGDTRLFHETAGGSLYSGGLRLDLH